MKRLQQIQLKLRAPKDQRNNFGGFNFRSAEGILAALKPLFEETGTLVLFDDKIEFIEGEETLKDGRVTKGRFYVKSKAKLYGIDGKLIAEAPGEAREEPERSGNSPAQVTGGSISYAHKYALCSLFAIDDSQYDPDTMDNRGIKEAIDDLMVTSTDRKTFEQAMKRHKEFMTNDDFRKACAELSKKYPKP